MKKSAALMVFAAAAGLVSCGGPSTPKANLTNDLDSLAYSLGVTNTQGLMEYAKNGLKIDSANIDKFVEGLIEGVLNTSDKETAKLAGMQIGQQLSNEMYEGINKQVFADDSLLSLNKTQFLNGFIQGVKGTSTATTSEAFTYVRTKTSALKVDSLKATVAIDSLSYMMGVSNSEGLIGYATNQMGVDSTYINDFTSGIEKGTKITSEAEKANLSGFQVGVRVGGDMYESINSQLFAGDKASLDKNNFLAGFIDGVQNKNLIDMDNAISYVRTKAEEIQSKAIEAQYGEYKKENEKFLADNKSKEGIKTTESGLQYRVIKEGKGAKPSKTSRVKVHYKGTLIDGTQFDSSYDRKEPTEFRCDQVISGWTEALTMMPVGSKWELYIPQNLAYGSRNMGTIKPFSTLIFEVELLNIEK